MGCGGDKDTKEESTGGSGAQESGGSGDQGAGSSGTQGGGDEKVTLAEFLPGKRLYVEVDSPLGESAPEEPLKSPTNEAGEEPDGIEGKGETPISTAAPGFRKMEMALQFEKDGKFIPVRKKAGKWVNIEYDLTYKVTGPLKVTVYDDGKEDGGLTFPTAQPKKGDKIKFGPAGEQMEATITKIEAASPMESGPGGGSGPDEPAPEPGDPSEESLPEAEPVEEKKK